MNDEGRPDRRGEDRMEFEGQIICSSTVLVCANEEDWFMHMTDYSPRQWLRSWWRWWTRRRGHGVVNSVLGCDGTGLKCVSTTRGWMWRTILWATNNDVREIADEVHTDPFCNWVFIYQIKLLYPYLSALLLLLMPPSAHPNNPPTHNNNIRVKLYLNDFSLFGAIRGDCSPHSVPLSCTHHILNDCRANWWASSALDFFPGSLRLRMGQKNCFPERSLIHWVSGRGLKAPGTMRYNDPV